MKTDDFISMLATEAGAISAPSATRRYATAMAWGAAGAMLLLITFLHVRHDLAEVVLLPMFWVKLGFVASLSVGSLFAVFRLSRPGAKLDWVPVAILGPVFGMWAIAIFAFLDAEPLDRSKLFFGETWKTCPLLIAMLSAPVFVAVIRAMKELAPTQLRLAGFSGGLLSGAVAAVVYCLHCPELGAPFVGFWYLLGMLIPALIGACFGESLLRW